MAYILNIESATDICSIAVSLNGKVLSINEILGNNHAEKITRLIEICLLESQIKITDLAAIAISNGPGSYTSLRVGVSTAKGICYALNLPLIAIDTLESLAWAGFKELNDETMMYCPMIDARRMEVYCALYQFDIHNPKIRVIEPTKPKIIDETSFLDYFEKDKKITFIGNGAPKTQTLLRHINAVFCPITCSANHLSELSYTAYMDKQFVDIAYHTPQYLKAPNITIPKPVL